MKKGEINQLVQEIVKELPPFVGAARQEVEQGIRLGLEALIKKMNLVSREEYDAQVALLHRLLKQVDDLEKRLAEAEKQ
ncbi:MAG: accessory factor UbiK family protein [Chromatiales bacterium]|nr:accessory factor UbiK family protein [Chromatiales bacterium]